MKMKSVWIVGMGVCCASTSFAAVDYDAAARKAQEILAELVAADTTNPPGNEEKAAVIGARELKKMGISYEMIEFAPGRKNLVARLKAASKEKLRPLLLLAHTDVVGTKDQKWSTDPHQLTEVGDYLQGRGASDDLGMAAIELEVMRLLRSESTPLKRDVILAWTGDEESGGAGIRHLLKNHRELIDAELVINESGGIALDQNGKVVLVSIQTAEKTYQDFSLKAQGPTGHSSVPRDGNAIYRLARALDRLGKNPFPARLIPATRAYFAARAAVEPPELAAAMRKLGASKGVLPKDALAVIEKNPILAAYLRTTCVATLVSGGTRENALPAEAKANVNCRILPDEKIEDVRNALARIIQDPEIKIEFEKEMGIGRPSPVEGPVKDAVTRIAQKMWPGAPIIPVMAQGATDSRFLREAGFQAYGVHSVPNTETDSRRAHGIDERIPKTGLRTGVEFLHRVVQELAQIQ